jgi:hypothetical protein
VPKVALAYYEILKAGGFTTGGTNFDAKLRRQSLDPEDLILAHVGAMDVCARGPEGGGGDAGGWRAGADARRALRRLGGLGISARLDAVSAVMLVLVTFVGWVVVRYAATYMDGEARQGAFTGWLCATLAAVMLLVIAGNTLQLAAAWILTSVFLHKLLLFYPERVAAQRAARKKWGRRVRVTRR